MKQKALTTFQLSEELRTKAAKIASASNISVSDLVVEGINLVIREYTDNGGIPSLAGKHPKLRYTSILIPEAVRTKAKVFVAKHDISLGDLFRFSLEKITERKLR